MDKKAQVNIGWLVVAFIAVSIGLALFISNIAPDIGRMTNTFTTTNQAGFTFPASTSAVELTPCGQKALTISLTNHTDGYEISSGNYTTSQAAGSDGYLSAFIQNVSGQFSGREVNVTCTYQPRGYIDFGASRAVAGLIAILFALMIMVSVIPDLRNGILDFIGRR